MKEDQKTITDDNFDKLWTRLDKDGSGDVSLAELANY